MNDDAPDAATHPEVGKRIGLTYSAVSRIRSGDRYPSLAVMRAIEREYAWPVAEQQALIPTDGRDMKYADEFASVLNRPRRKK